MDRQIWIVLGTTVALWCGCATELAERSAPPGDDDPFGNAAVSAGTREPDPESFAAYDPFAGELPDLIVAAHALQLGGDLLDIAIQRALFDYAGQHPDDARPWLLLARDSMRREWGGLAVRQYRAALEADPRVALDPSVRADLIEVAGSGRYGGYEHLEASALIAEVWGAQTAR